MAPNNTARRSFPGARKAAMLVAAMSVGAALQCPAARAKGDTIVRAPSGVSYVSGGAGTESIDRLRSMEKDFNVKLVFAHDNGVYLADVDVTIVDASNKVLLETVSEGPWLLARLPAGTYQVTASYDGQDGNPPGHHRLRDAPDRRLPMARRLKA